jgi:hypothetical protein
MLRLTTLSESGLHALASWVTDLLVQREKHGYDVKSRVETPIRPLTIEGTQETFPGIPALAATIGDAWSGPSSSSSRREAATSSTGPPLPGWPPRTSRGSGSRTGTSRHTAHHDNKRKTAVITKIVRNENGNPPGKFADAELHFSEGPLDGLKLTGFGIWESRNGGRRNVTLPARLYSVNGVRRGFALLRPVVDIEPSDRLRHLILDAYARADQEAAR